MLLAFYGDSDKDHCFKLWSLLQSMRGELIYPTEIIPPFQNTEFIYIVIDNYIQRLLPDTDNKVWKDIKPIEIKYFLDLISFNIGDEVIIKDRPTEGSFSITNILVDQYNNDIKVLYELSNEVRYYDNTELSHIPEKEIVGWQCGYCGKIMRSKKPHICNGSYRCNRLRFSPIMEDQEYIEIPKGYKFSHFEGNKIRLIKV